MSSNRRKNIVPTRRRRKDDDDDEGSVAAEVEDDSLSEGSAGSNGDDDADVEGSETSEQDLDQALDTPSADVPTNGHVATAKQSADDHTKPSTNGDFKPTADTNAMMHGIKLGDDKNATEEITFDEMAVEPLPAAADPAQPHNAAPRHETLAERSQREHREYLKQRDENPAFVPNRGGFFLHDNRFAAGSAHGPRAFMRGRGRGSFPGGHSARGAMPSEPTEQQWAHDLHESTLEPGQAVTASGRPVSTKSAVTTAGKAPNGPSAAAYQPPPNRSFSTSTLLGNVAVSINLPGMAKKVAVPNVAKKQHTLLPQHRPPLRRDKPVRISLPDQLPRYIFPSIERSFIFIPRALRPNQQNFARGRGRGSYTGSRRTSMYGGSTYSPSVAMSRRSSLAGGASQSGLRSPAAGLMPRQAVPMGEAAKPVVRLPPMVRQPLPPPAPTFLPPQASLQSVAGQVMPQHPQPSSIPMHQPRPQKTVSVADIESPASFSFNPPQQQQEQPFHQQVPADVNGQPFVDQPVLFNPHLRHPSHASQPSGTPLSHIPERAVYAPTFQPYAFQQPAGYFPSTYPPGTVLYPTMNGEMPGYSGGMAPAVMAPAFVPGAPYMLAAPPPPPPPPPSDANAPAGTVAHESNGMVYYYDSSQLQQAPDSGMPAPYSAAPPGGVMGIGGMMTPPGHFYYPQAPNGVYFGPQ